MEYAATPGLPVWYPSSMRVTHQWSYNIALCCALLCPCLPFVHQLVESSQKVREATDIEECRERKAQCVLLSCECVQLLSAEGGFESRVWDV